jgi:HAD superfamily hydrolase (TIGR01490 family)
MVYDLAAARWAVFDVDGTLLPNASMEQRFIMHLVKRGLIFHKNILSYFAYGIISALRGRWEEGFKNNKRYIKGLAVEEIRTLAEYYYRHRISPALSVAGLGTVEQYRKEGFKILIMSGSPDFLTEHLVAQIKPDHFVWTATEVKDGKFTGRITGLHPYGIRKRQILEHLQAQLEIDFDNSIVFANHHADLHHMQMFGKAVAVNPTPALKKSQKIGNGKY